MYTIRLHWIRFGFNVYFLASMYTFWLQCILFGFSVCLLSMLLHVVCMLDLIRSISINDVHTCILFRLYRNVHLIWPGRGHENLGGWVGVFEFSDIGQYSQGWFLTIINVAFERRAPKVGHLIFSCLNIHEQTSLSGLVLFKWLWNLINFYEWRQLTNLWHLYWDCATYCTL